MEHHINSNINYNFDELHPENILSASLKSHLKSYGEFDEIQEIDPATRIHNLY